MKKRLFAGALALLMIIGLLPVSSMLKKPVETQAAQKTYSYTATGSENFANEAQFGDSNFFKAVIGGDNPIKGASTTVDKVKYNTIRFNQNSSKQMISFRVNSSKAKLTITYPVKPGKKDTIIVVSGDNYNQKATIDKSKSGLMTASFDIKNSGDYKIYKDDDSASITVYSIAVTEDPYTITVNDEKAAEGSQTVSTFYKEGEAASFKAADEANFLYWVNSRNKIVSRSTTVSGFNVYYDDEYTAVYKTDEPTVKYMTAYDQEYVSMNISALTEENVPAGPVKYGYEFDKWSKDVKTIINSTEDVEVVPEYKPVTDVIEISINGEKQKYVKNSQVEADATDIENFMYWYKNGNENEIVSYNTKYYFLADENITSITAKTGTDTVTKEGTISFVTKYTDNETNNKTFVFEFTVPDDCKILFAGIVASKGTDPTLSNYEYMRGAGTDFKTFKFSWTKSKATDTWHVMPVLKYMDSSRNVHTIPGEVVRY